MCIVQKKLSEISRFILIAFGDAPVNLEPLQSWISTFEEEIMIQFAQIFPVSDVKSLTFFLFFGTYKQINHIFTIRKVHSALLLVYAYEIIVLILTDRNSDPESTDISVYASCESILIRLFAVAVVKVVSMLCRSKRPEQNERQQTEKVNSMLLRAL